MTRVTEHKSYAQMLYGTIRAPSAGRTSLAASRNIGVGVDGYAAADL
jgi:hypothetical protein